MFPIVKHFFGLSHTETIVQIGKRLLNYMNGGIGPANRRGLEECHLSIYSHVDVLATAVNVFQSSDILLCIYINISIPVEIRSLLHFSLSLSFPLEEKKAIGDFVI